MHSISIPFAILLLTELYFSFIFLKVKVNTHNLYNKSIITNPFQSMYSLAQCWQNYQITKLQPINKSTSFYNYQMKLRRINRTSYGVTGFIDLKKDIQKGYFVRGRFQNVKLHIIKPFIFQVEVEIFFRSLGNNQFVKSPYGVSNKPLCDIINNEYRKSIMQDFHAASNFPYSKNPATDLCKLWVKVRVYNNKNIAIVFNVCVVFFQKKYTMNNYVFNKSILPAYLPNGLYKVLVYISNSKKVVENGVNLEFKLY